MRLGFSERHGSHGSRDSVRRGIRLRRASARDGARGNGAGRPAANRLRSEAAADRRGARPHLPTWSRCSVTPAASSSKRFTMSGGADWREGIAAALTYFGGVPRTLLGDNARPLVRRRAIARRARRSSIRPISRSVATGTCSRAPAHRIAHDEGKTEAGVKYVKRNALADQASTPSRPSSSTSAEWMAIADQRRHGTTHEAPIVRFERDERAVLRPLPARALPRRAQRLRRRVALDAFDRRRHGALQRAASPRARPRGRRDRRADRPDVSWVGARRDARAIDRAVCPRDRSGALRRSLATTGSDARCRSPLAARAS